MKKGILCQIKVKVGLIQVHLVLSNTEIVLLHCYIYTLTTLNYHKHNNYSNFMIESPKPATKVYRDHIRQQFKY